jgi:hypothetical protein
MYALSHHDSHYTPFPPLRGGGGMHKIQHKSHFPTPTLHCRWPPSTTAAVIRMDASTAQLSPYNSAQSNLPFCLELAATDPLGVNDPSSLLTSLCPLDAHDSNCLVMVVIIWEGDDTTERVITVRVTEPTYLPVRSRRNRQSHEISNDAYSYTFSLTMMPGMNYIVWCSSTPVNLNESLTTFAFDRPNIWLYPSDPLSSLLFYSTNVDASPSSTSPYLPIPSIMVSSFSSSLHDSPPQVGLLLQGAPSLLTLSRLSSGPFGLLHPTVGRIYPWLLQKTTHHLITSVPSHE